eukprot:m.79868 g.79868  ORF g.79868 m.79868 type:complete len:133 (+) comp14641_c0_seq6:598-996(+)
MGQRKTTESMLRWTFYLLVGVAPSNTATEGLSFFFILAGGMAMFEVDKVWTCCGVSGAKAPPCATMELSDLHVRCKRCGIYCLSFERETCQYHSGHLNLNAILVSKKYLWSCCTKYAGEDLGCNTVPKHYLP